MDAEILTRQGWKRFDQIEPDDSTIGYNPETGRSEWTPILGVNVCDDAPLVRLSNKTWSAVSTPNHRWMSSRLHQIDGRHVVKGKRVGKMTSFRSDEIVPADQITPFHSLRVAAEADTRAGAAISEGEAELLGWVMGDGEVSGYDARRDGKTALGDEILRIARGNPQASYRAIGRMVGCTHQTVGAYLRANGEADRSGGHWRTGTGSMRRIGLSQAKPNGVKAIDRLLSDERILFSRHEYESKGIARLPYVVWRLSASYSNELLNRSGYDHDDPVPFVLSLSHGQVEAFLRGIFGAEGHQGNPRMAWGRGPYPAQRIYSQADGPQQDAISLAIYLSGRRPAYHPWSTASRVSLGKECRPGANIGEAKPFIGGQAIRKEDTEHAAVWCPTTGLSTWTCRQNRQVMLTGNTCLRLNGEPPARRVCRAR